MMQRLKSFLRSVTHRSRLESDMAEELQFHLEARAADLERGGLTHADALRRARIEFGQPAAHIENMRHSLGLRWLDELVADILYGARILRKSPSFTLIAVLSLGLAIGANTTIFSFANEILFARLGVPHPDELRLFTVVAPKHSVIHSSWGSSLPASGGTRFDSFTYPIYQQLRKDNRVMQDLFAFKDIGRANVTADGTAQAVQVELVSGNFYEQIQATPALGRPILPADDATPGAGTVAILSDAFWQRTFARNPAVIGKVITVNMTPVTIIGVNPRTFTGAKTAQTSPDLFLPLSMIPVLHAEVGKGGPLLTSKTMWWVQVMARTKSGHQSPAEIEQARAALDVVLNAAIQGTVPIKSGDLMPRLTLDDGSKGLNFAGRQFAQPMYVLLGMVGFILLLACANIANLMLARATARQREMGVRLALGAGRWRILRQVLTESILLSFLGGALGVALGYLLRNVLPALTVSSWETNDIIIPFDWRVFGFTAGVTLLTGILFGLAPAFSSTRAEIGTALKEGGKSATRTRKGLSGKAIVTFQVALSTLLVIAAGLFLRTLVNLDHVDPGFQADNLILFDISPPLTRYRTPNDTALINHIEETLATLPGVQGVSLTNVPFIAGSVWQSSFLPEGAPARKPEEFSGAQLSYVGADFLQVMQIPLLAGRNFVSHDTAAAPIVSLVNQALVKEYFPNQNPVGRRFFVEEEKNKDRKPYEIIGVIADTRYSGLREETRPMHIDLYRQQTEVGGVTFVVRTRMKPAAIVPSLRAAVQSIDRDLPLMDIRTQREQIDATVQQERLFATLTAAFGVLALALACVGIYGIMAYTVSQRTNEIGIRLALGAERGQVRRMVVRETTWLAIVGVAAGLGLALALGRVVKTMLYGLKPADPISLASSALLLVGVALASGWIPALRASRVEPMEALRHE